MVHTIVSEQSLYWQMTSSVILFSAIANFGYQLFKYYEAHDEFEQSNLMKGVCFGALISGVLCLFYSFLDTALPTFQAEWAFYMITGFSALGQVIFTYRSA
ncbi:MAG TPA: hypothetical protein DCX06_04805 [Opitutae bacterium]|nr:hypothetical protein [Opitutae bacterium]